MATTEIPLTTIRDILTVESDAAFEQIVKELPDMLIALRKHARITGVDSVQWPIKWRPEGAPSRIHVHCTDGVVTVEVPDQQKA